MKPYDEITFDWYDYNCAHFTREVWIELTGVDLGLRMPEKVSRQSIVDAFEYGEREVIGKLVQEIPEPVDPCLVLLSVGPRTVPHCGVYTGGALLHLPKGGRVEHAQLEAVKNKGGFKVVRFFR